MKTIFLPKISSWRVRTWLSISKLFIGCNTSDSPRATTVIRDLFAKLIHSIYSFLPLLIKNKSFLYHCS